MHDASANQVCLVVDLFDDIVSLPVMFSDTNFLQYKTLRALATIQKAGMITLLRSGRQGSRGGLGARSTLERGLGDRINPVQEGSKAPQSSW